MKNLVVGAAVNYDFEKIRNFIYSLKETPYAGDIVIFLSYRDAKLQSRLEDLGVKILFFEGARFYKVPPAVSRFFRFLEFLLALPDEYDRVFISDTRDVVFQEDPFAFDDGAALNFFMESPTQTIGSCKFNSSWIKNCFGRTVLRELRDKQISCVGTVLGNPQEIIKHFQKMTELLSTVKKKKLNQFGSDQAVHNFIIYRNLIEGFSIVENGVHVNTMAYAARNDFVIGPDSIIRYQDGRVVPVMHQYDRFDDIKAAIDNRHRIIDDGKQAGPNDG